MKFALLAVLIYLMPLTAFAQQIHYTGEGKVTIPLGKEEADATNESSPKYKSEIKAGIIVPGMSEDQVIEAIGEPYQKKERYWWYPDRKFIYFENGRVRHSSFPLGMPEEEL